MASRFGDRKTIEIQPRAAFTSEISDDLNNRDEDDPLLDSDAENHDYQNIMRINSSNIQRLGCGFSTALGDSEIMPCGQIRGRITSADFLEGEGV